MTEWRAAACSRSVDSWLQCATERYRKPLQHPLKWSRPVEGLPPAGNMGHAHRGEEEVEVGKQGTKIRVGIFGSCVSRDTFRVADTTAFKLPLYIARHSVVSMGTDARGHYPKDLDLSSAFQRTQIETDARGGGWERIEAVASTLDVLLWDLVDERHGFVRFKDGTYTTRSVDLLSRPALADVLSSGETVPFGSDRHFAAWQLAVDRFVDRLRAVSLLERTLVVAVPWAEQLVDGTPAPTSMGTGAREANLLFERYYSHLESLGLPSITHKDPRGDAAHQWGAAPFHYEASVYDTIRAGLTDFVTRSGQLRERRGMLQL